MFFINGALKYQITTGGGVDEESGSPIRVDSSWSDPIPCNIKVNTRNDKGAYQDGKFTMASYEALIDFQPFETNRIQLTDITGRDLGDFHVQDIQFLHSVRRVKITV